MSTSLQVPRQANFEKSKGSNQSDSDGSGGNNTSDFSNRHLTKEQQAVRTSSYGYTFANVVKLFLGIAFLNTPQNIASVGIYGSILGMTWVLLLNLVSTWMVIKARDRFKYQDVRNLSDLVYLCYGEKAKFATDILVFLVQFAFLVGYCIFFGDEMDQLACNSFKVSRCGHSMTFRVVIIMLLLPGIMQKQLKNVAYFSIAALCCFAVAVLLVIYLEIKIISVKGYAKDVAGINFTGADLTYKYWDWSQMILGLSAFMSIFEGNSAILTVYAEADKPKQFSGIVMSVYLILALSFASWGILSYLAFGNTLNDLILIVLPTHNNVSIAAKLIYSLNICGSYVLMIQPIFSVMENYRSYQNYDSISPQLKFFLGRISVVVLTLLISGILPNVNSVLQLNGAICAPFVSCIVPFLCYYRAYSVADSIPVEQDSQLSLNQNNADAETNRDDEEAEAQPLITKA